MYEHLLLQEEGGIALLSINNPKSLNALNSATLQELNDCLKSLQVRKDIRVVIVTGAGPKAFVAGADISEMVNATPAEGRAMALLADEAFSRLEKMPQVTIAAVNGYALGGGCELAMACDIRIAAESAVFGQPECGLGILPGFGGTQRLARLDECRAMAGRILSKGSYAISLAKASIESGMDTDLASGLGLEATNFGLSFATHDKKEGMTAFLEKRPADLTDF